MINDSTMTTTINQSLCNAFYLMRLPIELYDSINQSINQSINRVRLLVLLLMNDIAKGETCNMQMFTTAPLAMGQGKIMFP